MKKEKVEKHKTSAINTRRGGGSEENVLKSQRENHGPGKGKTNNPNGRPPKVLCFTDIIREQLTRKKMFRRQDGSLMEASELELIALKVIQELRHGAPISHKLLNIVLDRIEGRPKESLELDGKLEVAGGLDARDVLLQRMKRVLDATESEEE